MIFDLGRRVTPISKAQFADLEQNRAPYPYPVQKRAQFAICYWQGAQEPWIWFVQLPLDERGLLKLTALHDFIDWLAKALEATEKLPVGTSNPFIFTPQDDKKAVFHAKLSKMLNKAPSHFYAAVQHYCDSEQNWQAWQQLGLQGIAELCVRLDEKENQQRIINALQNMPVTPLYALLGSLEHCSVPTCIAKQILVKIEQFLCDLQPDIFLLAALLRSLAGAPSEFYPQVIALINNNKILQHHEILLALLGRNWQMLASSEHLQRYLTWVAEQELPQFFAQIISDCATLPALRAQFLTLLHKKTTPQLELALQNLQKQLKERA